MANDYISRKTVIDFCEQVVKTHTTGQSRQRVARAFENAKVTFESIPAADVRPVVFCKDCKHAPEPGGSGDGIDVRFPDDACPFNCPNHWYNVRPAPEFFCANGERRDGGTPY